MKKLITFDPVFNPTAQTLDFGQYPGFQFDRLYGIINVTRSTPIYIPGVSGYGGSASGSVVTLVFNTSTHSTNDEINVYYETTAGGFEDNTAMEYGGYHQAQYELLKQIIIELRLQTILLQEGLTLGKQQEELEQIRQSLMLDPTTITTSKD